MIKREIKSDSVSEALMSIGITHDFVSITTLEPANIADGLHRIAEAIHKLAIAIRRDE